MGHNGFIRSVISSSTDCPAIVPGSFLGAAMPDMSAEDILCDALKCDLKMCVVMGFSEGGQLYFSSTTADGGNVIWLMESTKHELLSMGDD